jgi:L-fuconolactonase
MHGTPARRDFLRQSALAFAATSAGLSLAVAEEKKGPAVIDTHVHLWDLKQFKLPWLKPDAPFARDFKVEDFRKATAAANLTRAVYMEVDVAPEQKQAEADWVRELCAKGGTPIVAAVVGGLPASEGFRKYVTPFKGDPYIKGVRQVLHVDSTPPGFCLGKEFVAGVRLLGELGLSFDLCMRSADLSEAAKLIGMCPDTRFILDHCGAGEEAERRRQGIGYPVHREEGLDAG